MSQKPSSEVPLTRRLLALLVARDDDLRIHASGTGRAYPAHDAVAFAGDLRQVIDHGGGSARLRTDDPRPLATPRQLIEGNSTILEALDHARREGFTISVTGEANDVTIRLTR